MFTKKSKAGIYYKLRICANFENGVIYKDYIVF